jgi:hypothetical protein
MEDVIYFKRYKRLLEEYLNAESLNLKIGCYMKVVEEIKEVGKYINELNHHENKLREIS